MRLCTIGRVVAALVSAAVINSHPVRMWQAGALMRLPGNAMVDPGQEQHSASKRILQSSISFHPIGALTHTGLPDSSVPDRPARADDTAYEYMEIHLQHT
ncbi:MAG TPA: hypothetical protein ACQGQG_01215 [Xylella sp.]